MMNYTQVNSSLIEYNLIHLPQLVFEVTDACNLRCKYCGYSELYAGYDEREGLNFPFHNLFEMFCMQSSIVLNLKL